MADRRSILVIYRVHPSVLLFLTALFAAGCEGRRPGEAVSRPGPERDPNMTKPALEAVSRSDPWRILPFCEGISNVKVICGSRHG